MLKYVHIDFSMNPNVTKWTLHYLFSFYSLYFYLFTLAHFTDLLYQNCFDYRTTLISCVSFKHPYMTTVKEILLQTKTRRHLNLIHSCSNEWSDPAWNVCEHALGYRHIHTSYKYASQTAMDAVFCCTHSVHKINWKYDWRQFWHACVQNDTTHVYTSALCSYHITYPMCFC